MLADLNIFFEKQRYFEAETENESKNDIEKEKHKELSIVKSDAVGNPRTVMIHIEYTSLAG